MTADPRKTMNWRDRMLTAVCVITLLAVSVLYYYSNQPSFVKTYYGIYWDYAHNDKGYDYESAQVQFSGTKYDNGEFEGTITVLQYGRILYEWKDVWVCKVQEREFYIVPREAYSAYKEEAEPHYSTLIFGGCHAIMLADDSWEDISIGPYKGTVNEDGSISGAYGALPGITCPANSVEEAMAIVEELSQGTRFKLTFPKD